MLDRFCDKLEKLAGYAGSALFCVGLLLALLKADTVYRMMAPVFK